MNSKEPDSPDRSRITVQLEKIQIQLQQSTIKILQIPSSFQLIGTGTDAIVVQHRTDHSSVFKIYIEESNWKCNQEFLIYQQLKNNDFFPSCYEQGPNYLKLSYEKGPTLYQCLEKGIDIPVHIIEEVEEARDYVRQQGLNPIDIHLKNVILQNNHAKIVDVAEYWKSGSDNRWEHLMEAYHRYYPLIKKKKIPAYILETIKLKYQQDQHVSSLFSQFQSLISN